MRDRDGLPLDDLRVEELANAANVSLRTGCFCNPGAAEAAHHLSKDDLCRWFGRRQAVSYLEFRDQLRRRHNQFPSAIRISFGVASNFADAYRLVTFLQKFVDRSVTEVDEPISA
jgi:selenocysteine lyase/cysteine desulfurase